MNIEGNTYLIYDKYCDNHEYANPKTVKITLNDLYSSDYKTYIGKEAITEFNKFGGINQIDNNINTDFYQFTFFTIPPTPTDSEKKILCICVNHQKLKDNLKNIPNIDFLIKACSYHVGYFNQKKEKINIIEIIKIKSAESNADPTDPIIEEPTFSKLKLFEYQKRTVKWMYDTEKNKTKLNYSFNDEIFFGDIVFDSVKKAFISTEDRKKMIYNGGLLADEVGLGKTWESICAALMNPAKDISYYSDPELLTSKATLVICQNQIAEQWIREFNKTILPEYDLKVVKLFTKIHHDKTTYLDLLDADFIVVSYNYLANDCYYDNWIKQIAGSKKGLTWIKTSYDQDQDKAKEKIKSIASDIRNNPEKLFETKPLINCIKFHRIYVDEFHLLCTDKKNNYILKLLRLLNSTYRWVITGTPFDKSDECLENMVDYVTGHTIQKVNSVLELDNVQKYLLSKFFRKNTNLSRENEYKLKPIKEEVIKLKLTPTERAIYNAYIVNANVDKFSVQARQMCTDPRIVEELKQELSDCKTPEDIQKTMVNHHKKSMDIASRKVRFIKYKIKRCERRIKITEFRRYRKFLKQQGYKVQIDYPEKITDPEFDNKQNLEGLDDIIDDIDDNLTDEESDDDNDNGKQLIIINDANLPIILNQISKQLSQNPSITLSNMKDGLNKLGNKLGEATKQYEGKRSTAEFFLNMMKKINQITEKQKLKQEKKNDNNDEDDEDEDDDDEMCSICINPITGEDVGVTKCGHMYCFQCIKEIIQSNPKCPQCMKPTKANEIYMISFEDLSKKPTSDEIKDKISLINKVGTKLANLIFYIKNSKDKVIVFSQWDDLLKKVGDTLDTYGIHNVFCRGNVWTRDKAIREFSTKDNVKVIMLSSASAAAGTNLTAAKKVILLEPVHGTYEFRRNTERQAIGRAHRTGQTEQVTVVRFIIKDTVEDDIYNENIKEDAKFKSDVELKMLSDENLNLSKEEIELMAKDAHINQKKKDAKPKKKVKSVEKKNDKVNDLSDDDAYD